jgi:hypothetical protein
MASRLRVQRFIMPRFGAIMSKDNHDPRMSAVQRIEYHKPDLTLAYSVLAPLVTESLAYYECGYEKDGLDALRRAKAVIDTAAITSATLEIVDDDSSA